jgi:omega-hydroxy-beta-dihydromenaquinone-9 sulfotransferase
VLAGMPWEARGLARVLRPFVDTYLPETRLIDEVRLAPDSPTEDEVALANMCDLSYFQAIYFPRHFRRDYVRALTFEGVPPRLVAARGRALARHVAAVSKGGRRAPLLKNPAYTAQLGWLGRLFPEARIIHIHRDPRAVLASNARALRIVLGELALQRAPDEIDATILEAYPKVMDRVLRDARQFPADRFAEIAFERLVDDPLGTLGRVWDRLRLPAREDSLDAIGRYLPTVAGHRARGAADDEPCPEFGDRWRPYLERFGAPAPSGLPPRPRHGHGQLDAACRGGAAVARSGNGRA